MAKLIGLYPNLQVDKNIQAQHRAIERAKKRFQKKTFAEKYQLFRSTCISFRFLFHLFSILTGISFLASLMNNMLEWEVICLLLAGLLLLFWEITKSFLLNRIFEHYYTHFTYPIFLIGMSVFMLLGSGYVSIEGAKTFYQNQDESINQKANQLQVAKDSIQQFYEAEIQTNLNRIKSDSANQRNYYRGNLNWNLQQAHNLLLEENISLKSKMLVALDNVEQQYQNDKGIVLSEVDFNAFLFGCLSAINELLIMLIGWFLVFYDYNLLEEKKEDIVVDTSTDMKQLAQVVEELEALKMLMQTSEKPSVNDEKPKCQHCGKSFEKSTKWQKFCSSRCRGSSHRAKV